MSSRIKIGDLVRHASRYRDVPGLVVGTEDLFKDGRSYGQKVVFIVLWADCEFMNHSEAYLAVISSACQEK